MSEGIVAGNGGGRAPLSPVVRQLARKHGIDLGTVEGSGAVGRIRREDMEAAIARSPATLPAPAGQVTPSAPATAPAAPPRVRRGHRIRFLASIRDALQDNDWEAELG